MFTKIRISGIVQWAFSSTECCWWHISLTIQYFFQDFLKIFHQIRVLKSYHYWLQRMKYIKYERGGEKYAHGQSRTREPGCLDSYSSYNGPLPLNRTSSHRLWVNMSNTYMYILLAVWTFEFVCSFLHNFFIINLIIIDSVCFNVFKISPLWPVPVSVFQNTYCESVYFLKLQIRSTVKACNKDSGPNI